jgi:2-phosphosulfolactate phosphatase
VRRHGRSGLPLRGAVLTTFGQSDDRCRLEWGRDGARRAAQRGDVLVIVDTLSFSSAVTTAVHHGAVVCPAALDDDLAALAARHGAEVAVHRRDVPSRGRFSLSPLTYVGVAKGAVIVLAGPNGGTCSRLGRQVQHLFVGALTNARAVAASVANVLDGSELSVSVVACGERWKAPGEDGPLRFAIEDYLGAGAILSALTHPRSPDAEVCAAAFAGARGDLARIVWDCASGRELREMGYPDDVAHATQLDVYDVVPVLRGERLERA